MFEKDAEEYAKKLLNPSLEYAFKDGAEFGYNKCFEQIQKIVDEHTRLDCIIPELLKLKENK